MLTTPPARCPVPSCRHQFFHWLVLSNDGAEKSSAPVPAFGPEQVVAVPLNARDVAEIGHWGTGSVEVALASIADLDEAKPFIFAAQEGRGSPAPN